MKFSLQLFNYVYTYNVQCRYKRLTLCTNREKAKSVDILIEFPIEPLALRSN